MLLSLGLGQLTHNTPTLAQSAPAQTIAASQLVQQGVERYQHSDFNGAIEVWEAVLKTYQANDDRPNTAIVLENLARTYQQVGQMDQALQGWQRVTDLYRLFGNQQKVGRLLTEQAQAHSRLGQHRRAIALLCNPKSELGSAPTTATICQSGSAIAIVHQLGDRLGEAAALGSLGSAYHT